MSCAAEVWNAFEAGRTEGVRDHVENLRAFNNVLDPRVSIENKQQALETLRKNQFKKTADALETWLKCVTST